MSKEKIVVSGKKKTSVAKVKISEGSGSVFYNKIPYEKLETFHRLALEEPIQIFKDGFGDFKFSIEIKTNGGGKEAQIQAARLGIAKALVKFTNNLDLKKAFLKYDRNMLVADVRKKEARKPGDSKARAKRQTSYR